MKIKVDFDLCESNALCEALAPTHFQIDDDDFLQIVDENVSSDDLDDHWNDALVKLEHDVAHKSIAHYDVYWTAVAGSRRKITSLDISLKIESSGLEQRVSFLRDRVPFRFLFPNRQQTNNRAFVAKHSLGVNCAEPCELDELFG